MHLKEKMIQTPGAVGGGERREGGGRYGEMWGRVLFTIFFPLEDSKFTA